MTLIILSYAIAGAIGLMLTKTAGHLDLVLDVCDIYLRASIIDNIVIVAFRMIKDGAIPAYHRASVFFADISFCEQNSVYRWWGKKNIN
ncbi:MAG: hypothetical protein V8Q54_06320 [Alistipes senegalensis]